MGELWDVYNVNRKKINKIHKRGDPLIKGHYYLVVNAWIIDRNNRILLTKRHPNKTWGNYWECTGGFVQMGESSLQGALREVNEEIGIKLSGHEGILLSQECKENYLVDSWLFKRDIRINELVFQEEEVIDAKLVTKEEYEKMCEDKLITPNVRKFYKLYYEFLETK